MEPVGSKPLRAACKPSTRLQRKRLQSCSDTESCASARSALRKRPRHASASHLCSYDLCLYVRWHSAAGGVKVNRLPLDPIAGVDDLRGLFRRLIRGAFVGPGGSALPDYLTAADFYKFSPAEELISLPGDIARTEFRLVVTMDGWEYTLCERQLPGAPDPERKLLVTLAEFESDAVVVDDRQYVVRLLSYPTVCVKRDFLDAAVAQVQLGRRSPSPSPPVSPTVSGA